MSRRKIIIIALELIIIGILFVVIGCNELKKDKKKSVVSENTQNTEYADKTGDDSKGLFSKSDSKKAEEEAKKREEEERLAAEQRQKKIDEALMMAQALADEGFYEQAVDAVSAIDDFENVSELNEAYTSYVAIIEEETAKREHEAQVESVATMARLMVAQYNYASAKELIESVDNYEDYENLAGIYTECENLSQNLVVWSDNTHISHLFVHSLIVDTNRAFGPGSSQPLGYNEYMTTVDEFNKILEQMYERGYVLISPHDMAERVVDENGVEKLVKKQILLPEGKIPFVLSQDDVNYYLYMQGDGFAEKIVIGEDGLPTCEYIQKDGTVVYGEYDMVPIVDRFVREHPDFSYHGRKGILALTGYEGALGYDTGLSMAIYDGLSEEDKMAKINEERAKAIAVADALKAEGWEFASHSYTHSDMKKATVDKLSYDLRRWKDEVEIIVGKTDIYIYPYGADICEWMGYSGDKYDLMKQYDFWYFCNVDSSNPYWVQIRDGYLRQGRINADGLLMQTRPKALEPFFDVDSVLDKSRPAL